MNKVELFDCAKKETKEFDKKDYMVIKALWIRSGYIKRLK